MKISFATVLLAVASSTLALGPGAKVEIPFASESGTDRCLTAASNKNGAKVQLQPCSKATNQVWTLTKGSANDDQSKDFASGPKTQIKVFGSKCLDVTDGKDVNGTPLQIWTCDSSAKNANQNWNINRRFAIYNIKLSKSGTNLCVDLTKGQNKNGTQLQVWKCDNQTSNTISQNRAFRIWEA